MTWRAPVDDILFAIERIAGLDGGDPADRRAILEASARFCEAEIAPLDLAGDRIGARLENGSVVSPPGWAAAYRAWAAAGWNGVALPEAHGGMGLPVPLGTAAMEILTGASMAFATLPVLTHGAVAAIAAHGDAALRAAYLPPLTSGRWTAAMNLTEPQAGSDLGLVATRAVPAGDGSYRVTGSKIFITFGDHDLAENIVHLVLARLPDAPAGTRGLSLFLVPKHLLDPDGRPGQPNGVTCVGLEEKLGIHGSPTCAMRFDDAVGFLVGEPHRGLAGMFTMMNEARLATGLQGVAVGERALQAAEAHARDRRQGRAPGHEGPAPIIDHPDVRRMLGRGRALVAGARALAYFAAGAIERSRTGADPQARHRAGLQADLVTPIVKAWCSEAGVEAASLAIQVHGGAGYVEATGVARHWRDARIAPIYEGTNGIQAIDLITRKLARDDDAAMTALAKELAEALDAAVLGDTAARRLADALNALIEATRRVTVPARDEAARLFAATPYLRLAGSALAGGLLARGAIAAARDADRHAARHIALARVFAEEFAGPAAALLGAIGDDAVAAPDWGAALGIDD
jgi:hypothetical protein